FLKGGEKEVVTGMFAAAGDNDLRRFVGQPVLALELVGDGLAKFGDAAARRVFGEAVGERLDGGVFDVLRRVKVRLACAEADDIQALGLHLLGFGVDGQRQRRGERGGPLGYSVVHNAGKQIAGRAGELKRELESLALRGGNRGEKMCFAVKTLV